MVEQVSNARMPAWQVRIGDIIEDGGMLDGYCYLCRHSGPVNMAPLLTRWTQHVRLVTIEKRLHCLKCGATGEGACKFRVIWSAIEASRLSPAP